MMKRLIVLGIVAVMVMAASAAFAGIDSSWVVQIKVADVQGASAGPTISLGCLSAAAVNPLADQPGSAVYIYGVDAAPGTPKSAKDVRLAPTGGKIVWNLNVTAGSTFAGTAFVMTAWNPSSGANDIDNTMSTVAPFCKIELYKDGALLFNFDPTKNGAVATPQYTGQFSIAAGETQTGYQLVYSVPEPGSMVALFSGLVGLVGYGIRRRK